MDRIWHRNCEQGVDEAATDDGLEHRVLPAALILGIEHELEYVAEHGKENAKDRVESDELLRNWPDRTILDVGTDESL